MDSLSHHIASGLNNYIQKTLNVKLPVEYLNIYWFNSSFTTLSRGRLFNKWYHGTTLNWSSSYLIKHDSQWALIETKSTSTSESTSLSSDRAMITSDESIWLNLHLISDYLHHSIYLPLDMWLKWYSLYPNTTSV